jgi:hypothetical protein
MPTTVLIIWRSVADKDTLTVGRASIIDELLASGKTDGKREHITPTTIKRVFVDEAAANEFISKMEVLSVQHGLAAPTFKKQ